MPVTAQEAAQEVAQFQRNMNGSRHLPATLSRIRRLQQEETFPICNVGPWNYVRERGSLTVCIPAYDPAKDHKKLGYAMSAPQPEVRREAKILDENEFTYFEDDGHQVASDMIGVGFGLPKHNALTQYGVFIPAGSLPTQEEIAAARHELSLYIDRLINEARQAFDAGPKERAAVINDRHLWAARQRGLSEAWVSAQHTQESIRCDSCGRFGPADVARCQCGNILNFEIEKRNVLKKAQQERELEEIRTEVATRPKK
jgi:hypothetical protein